MAMQNLPQMTEYQYTALTSPVQTPVARAYREWSAYNDWLNTAALTEDEFDACCAIRRRKVDAVRAAPTQGAEDVLRKLLAFTDNGTDFSDDGYRNGVAILAEARALVEGVA